VEIPVERVQDVAVATVPVEELDASNATEFKADVAALLDTDSKVVFDLRRVRFADSSGLGALISCLRKVNARGGDLKLCALSDQVRGLFELVRMHKVFEIHATREEAVRAFQS
jgi:anti-sigma B factor antagonist